ncbi:MAG: hypothetical protein ACREEM_06805, partial [Blastocatellia bacterium]
MHIIVPRAELFHHAKPGLSRAISAALLLFLFTGQIQTLAQTSVSTSAQVSQSQSTPDRGQAQGQAQGQAMTLADLERMALEGNPTMAQAEAAIRASEGRRVQAGLLPNPVIGYTG